jgi:hypothetical protein
VQAVDVLGHDGLEPARALELRKLAVRGVRLHVQRQHLLLVEPVEILGVLVEERVAEDRLGGIVEFLVVEPVHAAEVRDAGLRGHARAAEEHDVIAFRDPGF